MTAERFDAGSLRRLGEDGHGLLRPTRSRHPRATFPETAVLSRAQLADALGVDANELDKLDLPYVELGRKTRRYVWRQVLRVLEARAVA